MDRREGIDLTPDDRDRLQHLVKDGNTAQKHVRRARIVLVCADGLGTVAVARLPRDVKVEIAAIAVRP